jgi:hypothetical protein
MLLSNLLKERCQVGLLLAYKSNSSFSENFKPAFFKSLVANVTNNVPGFEINDQRGGDFVFRSLTAVVAVSQPKLTMSFTQS